MSGTVFDAVSCDAVSCDAVSCGASTRFKSVVLPFRRRFTARCHRGGGLSTVTWVHLVQPMSPDCPPDPNSSPIIGGFRDSSPDEVIDAVRLYPAGSAG